MSAPPWPTHAQSLTYPTLSRPLAPFSTPVLITLSLEVSHLAVVRRNSKQLNMWATVNTLMQWEQVRQPMGISVSCLISVHVRFRCCGLFTGDFLLACFVTELLVEVIVTCDFLLGTLVHLVQIENQSEKLNIKSCSVCDSSPSCFWKTEVYKHRIHFNNHLGLVI